MQESWRERYATMPISQFSSPMPLQRGSS